MSWAARLAERRKIFAKGPDDSLPKLTEPPFGSFVSDPDGHSENIAVQSTDLRATLHQIATDAGLPAAIVHNLRDDYLRAQDYGQMMDRGMPPPGYTKAVACSGCGPVLLWQSSPDSVIACPWCFRRRAGKPIPRPSHPATQTIKQGDRA